jgi:mRNA interferase RelE/StbE
MIYELTFLPEALREWKKLDNSSRVPLKKKLEERLANPRVEADRLANLPNAYKIKLRSIGYRLVYEVQDEQVVVMVIAVGRREDNEVYLAAAKRSH